DFSEGGLALDPLGRFLTLNLLGLLASTLGLLTLPLDFLAGTHGFIFAIAPNTLILALLFPLSTRLDPTLFDLLGPALLLVLLDDSLDHALERGAIDAVLRGVALG